MAVQMRWHSKSFSITPRKITPVSGFTTTYAIKQDTNDDTSGTEKLNTRGRAPEEPAFSVKYLAAAGASPRREFESWRELVGVRDYMYMGGSMYGENKFELVSAAVSDVLLDNRGAVIQAVVSLHFKEILPLPKKETAKTAADGKLTTTNSGSKEEAKKIVVAKTDKKLKSPYGTGNNQNRGAIEGVRIN